jgi:hypothetical protein
MKTYMLHGQINSAFGWSLWRRDRKQMQKCNDVASINSWVEHFDDPIFSPPFRRLLLNKEQQINKREHCSFVRRRERKTCPRITRWFHVYDFWWRCRKDANLSTHASRRLSNYMLSRSNEWEAEPHEITSLQNTSCIHAYSVDSRDFDFMYITLKEARVQLTMFFMSREKRANLLSFLQHIF